jgi:hypothetical protein
MNGILAFLALVLCVSIIILVPTYGPTALLVCLFVAIVAAMIISRVKVEQLFLVRLFVGALLARMLVGTMIYYFGLQEFFGGDAITYDDLGYSLLQVWHGNLYLKTSLEQWSVGGGWGMIYGVAGLYGIVGRNPLAVQFVNSVIGAATAPVAFLCAHHIFKNIGVARVSAIFVAFFPSLVLWSSQGLKDGPIVFLLLVSILAALKLGERLTAKQFVILVAALLGVLSLRFYIFYMAIAAIGGSFLIGMRPTSARSLARQLLVVVGVGLSLTYLGVLRTASGQFEQYGNLQTLQRSRDDLATSANTGFGRDVDVTTATGAISAIPIGATYLLFAPFPWQLANLRQSITLPEMIVWWASFPLLILGLWFTVKYRLRQSLPILIFTTMVTLAYSIFQGNVGTAYRQRSQLLVFYFIFVSVGYELLKERRQDRRQQGIAAKQAAMLSGRRV